ncbi:response regulator transcription factor [Parabacteroides sp. OttesenSCG-928-G07]|nr:response regulator transcription factor [Parabacteroides sp. OttesenSCG-928-G21]MDL2278000.1 response regulator transcription factor [Parabacteroides sp. OttesenSCG-928-G07]
MKKSILLLDDKPEIAKIISLYLSAYDVKYVENPLKAIAWLTEGNIPDLIISDINMPEMNGEEFLMYIKANEMFSDIPVFILSSVDGSEDRIRLFEKGADDFILKPFNPEELKVRVRRVLKQ